MNRPCREFHDRYHECLDRRVRPQADPLLVAHAAGCPECAEWLELDSIWDEPWQADRPEPAVQTSAPRPGSSPSSESQCSESPYSEWPSSESLPTESLPTHLPTPQLTSSPFTSSRSLPSTSPASPSLTRTSPPANSPAGNSLARGARLGAAVRWCATVAAGVVVCWLSQPRPERLDGSRWAYSPELPGAREVLPERQLAARPTVRPTVPEVGVGLGLGVGSVAASWTEETASLGLVGDDVGLGELAYDWLAPDTLSYAASSPALQRWKGEILATAPQFGGAALRPDLPWQLVRQRLEPQMLASQRFVDPVMQQLRPWSRTVNRAWNVWRRSLSGKALDSPATES